MPVAGASPARPITSLAAVVMHNQLWVLCGYSFVGSRRCSNPARYHLIVAVLFSELLAARWVTGCGQVNHVGM